MNIVYSVVCMMLGMSLFAAPLAAGGGRLLETMRATNTIIQCSVLYIA